ncbi:MAG: DUF6064 family protein [Oliverpabstia sp.]
MDAQAFWNVIGNYNEKTWIIQMILLVFLLSAIVLSYTKKIKWAAKFSLGITNLFIGIGFFAWYGTEPIQKYFALPLYLLVGALFLFESWHNKDDILKKFNMLQAILLLLYLFYPFASILLGNSFPQMVTYIMPCPVISLSIAVYAGYDRKNKALLALLTIWGLTGVKAIIFHAYEDLILLVCGLYGTILLISEIMKSEGEQ